MLYLSFLQFVGIVLFSSVTHEIFAYKKLPNVKEIANERVKDMEEYLYSVSAKVKTANLPLDIIE